MRWMRASALEFRIRYWLHAVVFALGLWAPWNDLLHADATGANVHLWGALSVMLTRQGGLAFGTASDVLLAVGIAFAFAGAGLRTWGSAYLGVGIVEDGRMHAGIVADGPYRRMRNPLYLGTFVHTLALTLLMSESGAIFTVILIGVMQVRLVLGEEAFLSGRLGETYRAYCLKVPRVWPALRPRVPAGGRAPRWGQAVLGEIYFWGVTGTLAFGGWANNPTPLIQGVIVSLGVSLVVRAVMRAEVVAV